MRIIPYWFRIVREVVKLHVLFFTLFVIFLIKGEMVFKKLAKLLEFGIFSCGKYYLKCNRY